MFTEALWGHIHGMSSPCSDAANVDPPPLSSDATNVDPSSLVSGFPRAGGGSPVDSQPPPPSLPPPSDDANVDRLSIAGSLPGAAGVLPADIQHPPLSLPQKLKFMVTLPAGEFDSDSNSQADTDSFEDRCHGYNMSFGASTARTGALSAPT
jgi:hypothetical protein